MEVSNKTKEMLNRLTKYNAMPYLIIVLLGIVLTIPLFTMNLSELNEFRIHIIRITNIKETIKQGIFPPFISNNHMMGFGYALNIFYGPITTYIPILISMITNTNTMALKIFTLFTVILSGITMYICSYEITNKKSVGLISALIYMAAPYKLTDIYVRNAVGEYTAFIFIPMIFLGIYEILRDNKRGNLWLISGASMLILSHTITTIYTAIMAIIYLLLNYKKLKNINIWKNLVIDIIFIIILTSFYTIPIVEHKMIGEYNIFNPEAMKATGYDVYKNTNDAKEWIRNELSVNKENVYEDFVFSFGLAMSFLMTITVFCYRKIEKNNRKEYVKFWILSLISLILCTKIFPWFIMPHFLSIIQFAWRMNGFFIFFISIVCGINAYVLANSLKSIRKIVIILIMLVIIILGGFGAKKYVSKYDKSADKEYEEKLIKTEEISPYNVNRDYMPLKAIKNIPYLVNRNKITDIIRGEATITNENKEKLKDRIEVKDVNNATLELPYLFYLGYTIKLNGNNIKAHESENGFICIDVNEDGIIEVEYTGTTLEKIGFIISGIGVLALAIEEVVSKKSIKRIPSKNCSSS